MALECCWSVIPAGLTSFNKIVQENSWPASGGSCVCLGVHLRACGCAGASVCVCAHARSLACVQRMSKSKIHLGGLLSILAPQSLTCWALWGDGRPFLGCTCPMYRPSVTPLSHSSAASSHPSPLDLHPSFQQHLLHALEVLPWDVGQV